VLLRVFRRPEQQLERGFYVGDEGAIWEGCHRIRLDSILLLV